MSLKILDRLSDLRQRALKQAQHVRVSQELLEFPFDADDDLLQRAAILLEIAVHDLISDGYEEEENQRKLRFVAADAFRLFRTLPRPDDELKAGIFLLRAGVIAVLGDKGVDAACWLRENTWPDLPIESQDWGERTWATVIDVWLRLIRKDGWSDRDLVLERVASLRKAQLVFEREYLQGLEISDAKATALELIGLYHLAKAAEILAHYITDGVVDGEYQIQELLETRFDRVLAICEETQMIQLEPLTRLLAASAAQMAENSIWTVTRGVNSRVSHFVRNLVDRGRGDKAIFDVLPPQRRVLVEKGLLGSSRRAVVVSLPTSSGKTMIAEFRILQALNQFSIDKGWVAYLVPTRALVNQISRQLRRDLGSLRINVEQVSPALEIDNVESELLCQNDPENKFDILVTTPEKLNLMLRQGWETTIGRPLTLVIVDEAHNIQDATRGLHLELLLASINSECQYAQFLLLTPFITNAREVAKWLGGHSSEDISLAVDWQPNDRVIGIIQAEKTEEIRKNSFDYRVRMETVHTSEQTLVVDDLIDLQNNQEIASTYSQASNNASTLAAIAAQKLQQRGPVIVMHTQPRWVWPLANRLKIEINKKASTDNISLVQKFLELELGHETPLIDLLSYGIGIHHAGLPDEVRTLMEWLFEEDELNFLVATTTIAHGVNFPVSGVVMASHQYPYGKDMPPEDFWNIAGRTGRISHGTVGVVGLAAETPAKAEKLREFINQQSGELNSALIELVLEAGEHLSDLTGIVKEKPEWSAFVQYLAHTYQQMGQPEDFVNKTEQILRSTFGFRKLRTEAPSIVNRFLEGVRSYAQYIQEPGQPVKLVDSTGFSLESVQTVLGASKQKGIGIGVWNAESLFSSGNRDLQNMMGILLDVPELKENLKSVTGGAGPDGDKLSRIVKDWVNGTPIASIAREYFMEDGDDKAGPVTTKAMTKCAQNLFGRLIQTTAWGLGALLSVTGSKLTEEELRPLSNLPSRVYYGVNDDRAIALRLLGVSRSVAVKLADSMGNLLDQGQSLTKIRSHLRDMDKPTWQQVLGEQEGEVYRGVWRILEGLPPD